MNKFITLSALFLVLVLKGQTSIPLVGYHKQTLWLEEKNGNYGLRNETQTLVPYAYDLILPTLQEEFAFIVKGKKIGVFDIKGKKEIELTSHFNELEIYPGKDSVYYLLYNTQSYGHQHMQHSKKLVRDESGKIKIIESKELDVNIGDCNYQNGILRIDSVHFLHHFTKLDWIKNYGGQNGEEQITFSYTNLLQHSGVFSLANKYFVIPAEFCEIDVPPTENRSSNYSRYIRVTKADNNEPFLNTDNSKKLNDLDDVYLYGLYSLDYRLIHAPQKAKLWATLNGGFYKYSNNLEVFNEEGVKLLSLHDSIKNPSSLIRVKDKFYVGYLGSNIGEMEMQIYTYYIFNSKKEFIKKETFAVENYMDIGKTTLVKVTNHPDSFNLLFGIYDLEKSEFSILPIYDRINFLSFRTTILECDSGNCDYYYSCSKNKTDYYFDKHFKPFYPKETITTVEYLHSVQSDEYGPMLLPYITAVKKTDKKLLPFVQAGMKIDVSCYCFFDPKHFEETYYGEIVASYNGLNILKVYQSPKDKPTYGLYYQNSDDFILEPFFDKIEFDLKNKALKITYKSESGSLLLERYFDEK